MMMDIVEEVRGQIAEVESKSKVRSQIEEVKP
jgi:hypothetical protein